MTDFGYAPEARGLGTDGSDFHLTLGVLSEGNIPTAHIELGGWTHLVVTHGDRQVILSFVPFVDGRLSIEMRGFVDEALQKVDLDAIDGDMGNVAFALL